MAKYHVNGKGEPGICRARKQCPFGDLTADHYSTAEEARTAYEEHAKKILDSKKPLKKTVPPKQDSVQEELFSVDDLNGDIPIPGLENYGR